MMAFRNRAADRARQVAGGGGGPPAGQDPQVPGEPPTPTVADRGILRSRLRQARRTRDGLLHELGALVMEMYRQDKHDPALVERKAREAIAVDSEVRALTGALERNEPLTSPAAAVPAAPPSPADRVSAPPPSASDLVPGPPASSDLGSAPPPHGDPIAAPPPAAADRADDGDGVPTYRVTTS
jgi:hypothetical protein